MKRPKWLTDDMEKTARKIAARPTHNGRRWIADALGISEKRGRSVAEWIRDGEQWETTVVFGDVHVPFQDHDALSLVMRFIRETQPDQVIINGDFADCYEVSSFSKDPIRKASFVDEVLEVRAILTLLRESVRNARIKYVSGNHEHRLVRYLIDNAKALRGLDGLSIPEQFHLDKLGIEWIPCKGDKFLDTWTEVGELMVGHFNMARAHSAYTAKGLLDQWGRSLIQAHVHSVGMSNKTLASGQIAAWEGGCLCQLDPHYCVPRKWAHAFHVVHRRKSGEFFHVEPVLILDGRFFYGGELWSA
mgnify:CR=1 FL=1